MTPEEKKSRLLSEPDFIALKRFDYSLSKLMDRNPAGCSDRTIAGALMIAEHEVQELYEKAIIKLRMIMGVEL